jgi:hypothetical protein
VNTLEFRFTEIDDGDERYLTTCKFAAFIDAMAVWPARGVEDMTLEIQIDDFLSHMTEYWKPLMLRQTYPFALNPTKPSLLRADAEKNWAALPQGQVAEEDEVLEAFQDCHDFSRCFGGYFDLPPLWMIRSGEEMFVDTAKQLDGVPYEVARNALQAAGDWIVKRLDGADSDRWSDLIASWRHRDAGDGIGLLQWSTGLDEVTIRRFASEGLLVPPANVIDAANDNDELRLAARMASALAPEQVQAILTRVIKFPHVSAPALDDLAKAVRTHLNEQFPNARPFEQGEEIATFVRRSLKIPPDMEVDIFTVVESLGVQVYREAVEPPTLDALAIWGGQHGPAALLNMESKRHAGRGDAEERGQIRVTLAHELCHFLADREHALGAVDVLRSRMPVAIEQRARAFAAEFLLPSKAAGDAWLEAKRPTGQEGLEAVLDDLCKHFTVSKSVASWKLEHGARSYHGDLHAMLDSIVPQR